MHPFPLQAVLFWIAVTLAPPDTSQILVKGPDATWAWTRQSEGWIFSGNRNLWTVEGETATTRGRPKIDLAKFVQGINSTAQC